MEKVRAELALFSVEKVCALHLTSVLLQTIATSQSVRWNFQSYCHVCSIYSPSVALDTMLI